MLYTIIPLVLVGACVVLTLKMLGFLRAERTLQQGRVLANAVLPDAQKQSTDRKKAEKSSHLPAWMKKEFFFARMLRAAGITYNPALCCIAFFSGSVVLGIGTLCISGEGLAGLVAFLLAWALFFMLLRYRQRKRRDLLDTQLAQALPQITASVRSSLTFERALRVVVVHLQDPLRSEFIKVLSDVAYGVPLYEALEAMAVRTSCSDIKTLAAATKLRQGSGGSIASALSMVSTRVNARLKAARELKVEIASTRLAKWVVALAMPAIFALMFTTNTDFAQFYTSEPLGWTVLGIAAGMEVIGLLLSHRITAFNQ